jgi:exosortase A
MSAVLGTTSPTPANPARPWRWPLVGLGLVLLVLLVLYRDTLVAMVLIWHRSETFAHCFLVPPISAWLAWRNRARLVGLQPAPQPWLLLALAAFAALWWLADVASINAATQFAFTALLVLSVPALLGLRVARVMAFPLLFLFFMVPVGEFLLPWFMDWTADFTIAAVRLSGIPVYREGLNFIIPSGSWSVVEACSGVRYMIASFMVGSLFAYLNYHSLRRRLVFCGIALLVPLVANWLRAYMIVMLGHLSGNKIAVGVDHLIYGWVFFGIVIGLMFWIGARWAENAPAPAKDPAAQPGAALALRYPAWVPVAASLLIAMPHAGEWQAGQAGQGGQPGTAAAQTPLVLPELGAAPAAAAPDVVLEPHFEKPSAVAMRHYAFEGDVVTVHVAWYAQQTYGSKLASSNNLLVPSEDPVWRRVANGTVTTTLAGKPVAWLSNDVFNGQVSATVARGQRFDVRQVYWVDGQWTPAPTRATLIALASKLQGRGDAGAMLTIYTRGDQSAATAERLNRFLQQHLGAIESTLKAHRAAAGG